MHDLNVHCNHGCHLLRHLDVTCPVQEEENEAEDVEVPTEVLDFFLISSPALHDILHIRYGI